MKVLVPVKRVVDYNVKIRVKADGSAGQTYEERLATRRSAQPVVGGLGVLVAGFGAALLVADLRRPKVGSAVEDAR